MQDLCAIVALTLVDFKLPGESCVRSADSLQFPPQPPYTIYASWFSGSTDAPAFIVGFPLRIKSEICDGYAWELKGIRIQADV